MDVCCCVVVIGIVGGGGRWSVVGGRSSSLFSVSLGVAEWTLFSVFVVVGDVLLWFCAFISCLPSRLPTHHCEFLLVGACQGASGVWPLGSLVVSIAVVLAVPSGRDEQSVA